MKVFWSILCLKVIIIVLFLTPCFFTNSYAQGVKDGDLRIISNKITKLKPFGFPDTLQGEYFYGIHDLACSDDGRLYLADHQSMSVRVFNVDSEVELYRIGTRGSGPGEFRQIARIRILTGNKLAVIDNNLRRCTLFDLGGKLLRTISLIDRVDDLDIIDENRLILSSFIFDSSFKPLRILDTKTGILGDAFGKVVDPKPGLLAFFDKNNGIDKTMYSAYSVMTKIIAIPGSRKIIYAQKDPYCLVMYDIATREEMRFERKVPFETEDNLQINIKDNGRVHLSSGPRSGIVLSPIIVDHKVVVAVFNGDGRNNFLDVYNLNMKHLYRLRIPPLEKDVRPFKLCLYKMQLLLLVSGPAIINWVERMRVDFIP